MQRIRETLKQFIKDEDSCLEHLTIKSVDELDERFRQTNDIYSFYYLIEQITANIPRLPDKLHFNKYLTRLIEAICFLLEKYAYDCSRTNFLMETLGYVAINWRKKLVIQSKEIKNQPNNKFRYVLGKNQYTFFLLKSYNMMIQKEIFRLVNNQTINLKSLYYLRKNNMDQINTEINAYMMAVAQETENQTHLKIDLLLEFLKTSLFQINFCLKYHSFEILFSRIFQLSKHLFRLIKKFYNAKVLDKIKELRNIIIQALKIFKEISDSMPVQQAKLYNLIWIIGRSFEKVNPLKKSVKIMTSSQEFRFDRNKPYQSVKLYSYEKSSNSYAVKMAYRLLKNWKKVKAKKVKESLMTEKMLKSSQSKRILHFSKIDEQNQRLHRNYQNSDSQHKMLKSRAKRSNSVQNLNSKQVLPSLHKVQIRKQIEDKINIEFQKLAYLKKHERSSQKVEKSYAPNKHVGLGMRRSFSTCFYSKTQLKPDAKVEERELQIEQYREKLNMCRKSIDTLNSIQLYQSAKKGFKMFASAGAGGEAISHLSKFASQAENKLKVFKKSTLSSMANRSKLRL